ncbi:hypothetical protein V8C34DRAFT_134320 [Trichoderma compactum]
MWPFLRFLFQLRVLIGATSHGFSRDEANVTATTHRMTPIASLCEARRLRVCLVFACLGWLPGHLLNEIYIELILVMLRATWLTSFSFPATLELPPSLFDTVLVPLVSTKALPSIITAPQAVIDKDFCARKIPHIINTIPPPAAWTL